MFYVFVYADGVNTSTSYRDKRGRERYRVAGTIRAYRSKSYRTVAMRVGYPRPDFHMSGLHCKAEAVTVAKLRSWGFTAEDLARAVTMGEEE